MNRVFKRSKTGRVHRSEKQIHFSFDSKIYPAYEGDTIEAALYSNNLVPYARTNGGDFLTSFGGIYKAGITALIDKKKQNIAIKDFLMSDGLELEQSNKVSFKNRLINFTKILNGKKDIFVPDNVIDYTSRIKSYFDESYSLEKEVNIEKNYIHTDIAIVGAGAAGLYAALLSAEHGLNVVICDKEDISCLDYKIADKKYKDFIIGLKKEVLNHSRITIKNHTQVRLANDNQLVGFQKPYAMPLKDNKFQQFPLSLNIIQSKKIILATGLNEVGFIFQGHEYPNALLAREFIHLNTNFAIEAGGKIVLYTSHDTAYDILCLEGVSPETVTAIIDTRSSFSPAMVYAEKAGYKVFSKGIITHTNKGSLIESVSFRFTKSENETITKTVSCDLLVHSAGFEHDISVGIEYPENLAVCVTKTPTQTSKINVKLDLSSKPNILQIGYGTFDKPNRIQSLASVFEACKNLFQTMNIDINPQLEYDFGVHAEICMPIIDNYDILQLPKKENIHILRDIDYAEYTQTINRYEFPLDAIRWLKSVNVFSKSLTACFMLLHRYAEVYNLDSGKYKSFLVDIIKHYILQKSFPTTQHITDKVKISGYRQYHALKPMHVNMVNKHGNLITPDVILVGNELGEYYKNIVNQAGILINNTLTIIDFYGRDCVEFLEKCLEKPLADLPIGSIREFTFVHEAVTINIWHSKEKTYRIFGPSNLKSIQKIKDTYHTEQSLHIAMFDISHAVDKITLVGKQAFRVFQEISKLSSVIEKDKIQEIWIENVLLHYFATTQYHHDFIEIFITSDASASFFEKLKSQFNVLPFQDSILKIMALEAGQITDFYPHTIHSLLLGDDNTSNQTDHALIVPVIGYSELKKTDFRFIDKKYDIFSASHSDNLNSPDGHVIDFIYSPYYQNYVGLIAIKDANQWQNKIMTIVNKENGSSIKGKVVSEKFQMLEEISL